jgi:ligand-binding sensor domain-containing protein/DNA-binding response OmpR family regulator/nitrogen-specific signal transduction histidine kinase
MSRNPNLFCLKKLFLLLILLSAGMVSRTEAQETTSASKISFNHLTVENGLSQSGVLSIAQDSMGFMWFGTKDGLNKFNGQTFEVFKHDEHNPASLSSSRNINTLLTDSKGKLWIGTQNGLNLYLPESNSFRHFVNDPNDQSTISNNIIRDLFQDRQGNLWVGTENGLNKLLRSGKFQRFYSSPVKGRGIAHNLVKAIHQDHKNVLWIGTADGLTGMESHGGKYVFNSYFHDLENSESLADNDLNAIFEDSRRNLWIGTHKFGLELMDRSAGKFKHYTAKKGQPNALSSNVIRKIKMDSSGKLWISTLNGLSILDVGSQKFANLLSNPDDPSSLNQNSVYDILQDAAGSMWLGTYYGGINVYHTNSTPFRKYKANRGKNGISSNVVGSIVEDRAHNLWIGTEAEGLNYYNRTTGLFSSFKADGESSKSLSSNLVKAISIDRKGWVWVGTYEGGLDVYIPETGAFKHYKPGNLTGGLNTNRIVYMLHDSKGRLWLGTRSQGIYTYNEKTDDFSAFSGGHEGEDLRYVHCFYEDARHNIWLATNSGTYIVPVSGGRPRRFEHPDTRIRFDDINFIREDSKGIIWLGSYESGLIRYDPVKNDIHNYTEENGLPSNNALGLLEDKRGFLWISTSNGLSKFDGRLFTNYTVEDGLPGNVFNINSFFKDSRGEMFFGGYNGMVSFFPEQIRRNRMVPKAVFSRLKLFNKPVIIGDETKLLTGNISLTKEINFSYHQNIFTIDFALLNYIKAEKNRYAYKLEGFEKEWNYVSTPSASFTNLPAGTYTLLVKGANNDGVWTSEPARLTINVHPPFWKTWWAYLFYVICIAGLVFLVFRYLWMQELLKREHEIYQMKLDFFTNVSHEIRTPLTLIVGPLENLVNETRESPALNRRLLTVKKNAGRLTRLVNELMDFRKAESGNMKLNVVPGNIVSFAQEIYLSFQYLAIKHHINYHFNCKEEAVEVYFDPVQLEKVLFNLLSNAFKFTPDHGTIIVDLGIKKETGIEIKVSDNGKGIPEESRDKIFTNFYQVRDHQSANSGTGIGLSLAEKIARLHHGGLILMSAEEAAKTGMQTCFSLRLKLGRAHFNEDEFVAHYVNVENPVLYQASEEIHEIRQDQFEPAEKADEAITILIVEDNAEVREFISSSLKQTYHILEAENGREGVDLAMERIPDIIVSDVMMPVMDGLELCRILKTDARTSHIPIILLTARSGNIHEVNGLKTGAEAYLTKPFSINSLQLHIYNMLTLQANMRRKFSQQITLQPANILIESADEEFLARIMALIENNFAEDEFNVNTLASEVGMSTPVLYKKIKALTGLTVNNFIKSVRLKRAAQLLQQGQYTVYEVAYMVGFSDSKYFSREFSKQFGKNPSSYEID